MVDPSPERVAAPFNMALATLERISDILREIRKTREDPFLPPEQKQQIVISLVKDLFSNSAPLLKESVVSNLEEGISNLQPKRVRVIDRNRGQDKGERIIYDFELEKKLDKHIIKIQQELQKDGYFMPPKKDKRRAVAEF